MTTGIAILAILWIGLIIYVMFFYKPTPMVEINPPEEQPASIEQRIKEGRI